MKKILFMAAIAAVCIGSIIFQSCSKSGEVTLQRNVQKDLKILNDSYKTNNFQNRSWKQWCQIAVADVGGAWAGSWAGGKIGGAIGTLIPGAGSAAGASIGAAVGAAVIGAAASYGASSPIHNSSNFEANIYNFNNQYIIPNINNNQFDISVGLSHNTILLNSLKGNTYLNNSFSNSVLSDQQKAIYNESKVYIDSLVEYFSKNSSTKTTIMYIERTIDNLLLKTVMIEYINGISNVNDLSSALNLTYAYEKYVIGNSCFTLNQQNVLLSGFATAKYSYYFWNSIL
jgi:hypothetical protein